MSHIPRGGIHVPDILNNNQISYPYRLTVNETLIPPLWNDTFMILTTKECGLRGFGCRQITQLFRAMWLLTDGRFRIV